MHRVLRQMLFNLSYRSCQGPLLLECVVSTPVTQTAGLEAG
jgi:hypothetical protein